MAHENDPLELRRVDQDIRINQLREEVIEMTGGQMTTWESPDCPPEILEQFWANVRDYEKTPVTTHADQLLRAGVDLPAPATLTDEQLHVKLWEVIHKLAQLRVFLYHTDHLSERELYSHLWNDSLREATMDFSPDSGWTSTIDLVGSGSEEDMILYFMYFADELSRKQWKERFADYEMPERKKAPHHRDKDLPKDPLDRTEEPEAD